jgi:hypothetical protein
MNLRIAAFETVPIVIDGGGGVWALLVNGMNHPQ